jgi:hypothetical protein
MSVRSTESLNPYSRLGILRAHAKRNDRSGITQHRMPDIRIELVQILMSDREAHAVLTHP